MYCIDRLSLSLSHSFSLSLSLSLSSSLSLSLLSLYRVRCSLQRSIVADQESGTKYKLVAINRAFPIVLLIYIIQIRYCVVLEIAILRRVTQVSYDWDYIIVLCLPN